MSHTNDTRSLVLVPVEWYLSWIQLYVLVAFQWYVCSLVLDTSVLCYFSHSNDTFILLYFSHFNNTFVIWYVFRYIDTLVLWYFSQSTDILFFGACTIRMILFYCLFPRMLSFVRSCLTRMMFLFFASFPNLMIFSFIDTCPKKDVAWFCLDVCMYIQT